MMMYWLPDSLLDFGAPLI